MHIQWDDNFESDAPQRRQFGIPPVAVGLAVPVAFILGAAVMNYMDMSHNSSSGNSAGILGEAAGNADDREQQGAERERLQAQLENAENSIASLRVQLRTLREQLATETRLRFEAEQAMANASAAGAANAAQVSQPQAPQDAQPAMELRAAVDPSAEAGSGLEQNPSTPEAAPQRQATADPTASESTPVNEFQRLVESSADRSASQATINEDADPAAVASQTAIEGEGDTEAPIPRVEAEVDRALNGAGLEELAPEARSALKNSLLDGQCVSESLEMVFGNPVPVVPLRNLLHDLNSNC